VATVPAPRTWTVGELLTASKLNTDLRNGLNFLLAPPLAVLDKIASQGIPTGANTAITFTSESIDRDGGHDNATNPSRYTAQTAGWYSITLDGQWANATTGVRRSFPQRNGSVTLTSYTLPPGGAYMNYTRVEFMSVGDYMEMMAFQDSGGTVNFGSNSRLSYLWLST
jgi:hypothetical protein